MTYGSGPHRSYKSYRSYPAALPTALYAWQAHTPGAGLSWLLNCLLLTAYWLLVIPAHLSQTGPHRLSRPVTVYHRTQLNA
jgi:hypothetical protein